MLDFAYAFCSLQVVFHIQIKEKKIKKIGIQSECQQLVWAQNMTNGLSGVIWVQTVNFIFNAILLC